MMSVARALVVLACLPFILFGGPVLADDLPPPRVEFVVIETDQGQTMFNAEIADTPELRQRGLMFRQRLPQDQAMLFDFIEPRPVHMWMKNTYISLDMIFIDAGGKVIGISKDTVPQSENIIGVEEPVKAVLEVAAGTAARIGLKPGDKVIHQIFGNSG